MIQAEQGNLNTAIKQFEILENLGIEDSSRALWYKALIYLKFNKKAEAEELLNTIVLKASNYKYKKAKELLDEL